MTKEMWIATLKDAYNGFQGLYLSDDDCKELMDLLKE